jgi:hypothetical protein
MRRPHLQVLILIFIYYPRRWVGVLAYINLWGSRLWGRRAFLPETLHLHKLKTRGILGTQMKATDTPLNVKREGDGKMRNPKRWRYLLLPAAVCFCLLLQILRAEDALDALHRGLGNAIVECLIFPLLLNSVVMYNSVGLGPPTLNAWICLSLLYWGFVLFSYMAFIRSKSQKWTYIWAVLCCCFVLIPAFAPGPVPSDAGFGFPDIRS